MGELDVELIVSNQTMVFLYSCLLGVGLGVCYDVFRILRVAFPLGTVVTFVEDIIYFAIAAVATFTFLLYFTQGQLRVYVLLGELLGFIVYYFTIGFVVIKISKTIVSGIRFVLRGVYQIFLSPFVRLFRFVGKKFCKLFVNIGNKAKNAAARQKFNLKKKKVLLYNLNNHHSQKTKGVKRNGKGKKKKN